MPRFAITATNNEEDTSGTYLVFVSKPYTSFRESPHICDVRSRIIIGNVHIFVNRPHIYFQELLRLRENVSRTFTGNLFHQLQHYRIIKVL